ncbi:MAG: hypothetical protein WC764_02695 [Candidatus Paceibacterota bacterium]|jgi:hypothetical protein
MTIEFLRSYRVGPFAIFDFALSYVAVYFLAPYLSKLFALVGISINREQWLWLTLPIALITHLVFRIDTPFTRMMLDPSGGYIAKFVIIFMLIMVYVRR